MGTMQHPASFERRTGDRHKSVLAVGKVVKDGRERFCLIRDISTGGLMVETNDQLAPGDTVMVETLGLPISEARVVWSEGKLTGLAFGTSKDPETICRRGVDGNGHTIRAPRFQSDRPARLRLAGRDVKVNIANISVGGARLIGVSSVHTDAPGELIVDPHTSPIRGHVRWVADNEIGFRFAPALERRTLVSLIE